MRLIITLLLLLILSACTPGAWLQTALGGLADPTLTPTSQDIAPTLPPTATPQPTATPEPTTTPQPTLTPTPTLTPSPAWELVAIPEETNFPAGHYAFAITRPEAQPADSDPATWINRQVADLIDAEIAAFEAASREYPFDPNFPGALWIGYSVPSSGADPAVQVVGVHLPSMPEPLPAAAATLDGGHAILSLLVAVSPYTGGAHPGLYHVPLNLDFTTGQVLQLADLFTPGSNYLGLIAQIATADLKGREAIFQEQLETYAGPNPDNYRLWELGPDGLWIVFDPYQVAPWAAGPQFVLIPYEDLAGILDPGGPLGNLAGK